MFRLGFFCIILGIVLTSLTPATNGRKELRYNIISNNANLKALHSDLSFSLDIPEKDFEIEYIFPELGIYNLVIQSNVSELDLLNKLKKSKAVLAVEKDSPIQPRGTTPNDIDFDEQWNLSLINATDAWDITTGGKTSSGKEIVVAVIDDGFDFEHDDLVENLWTNKGEIPNNGIDDDNNGYRDDYLGVNTRTEDGVIPKRTHGTSVAGIVGAKGDNNIGVAGVNWNIKIMLLAGQAFVSDIIESYNYILVQRKLYNDSNGEKGAFVVVSNFSSGINEAFAEDFPVWCAIYDELGKAGILNVGATANNAVDVDVVGDMPGTCPSDFLIITNNVTQQDVLARDSGFGIKYVDIAAPGEDAFTLKNGNSYGPFSGTSSSAPHIAGAIALFYATPRPELDRLSTLYPARAATAVKNTLLNSARKLENLTSKNSSGGILDLSAGLKAIDELFNAESSFAFGLRPNPTQDNLIIDFLPPENEEYSINIYNTSGAIVYSNIFEPIAFDFLSLTIDVSQLKEGLYFISLNSESKILTKSFTVF